MGYTRQTAILKSWISIDVSIILNIDFNLFHSTTFFSQFKRLRVQYMQNRILNFTLQCTGSPLDGLQAQTERTDL